MKSLVLDTNILLDIFVFQDERAADLRKALLSKAIRPFSSQATLIEFADVLSRPLFCLEASAQEGILSQWKGMSYILNDADIPASPWKCSDPDDQIFLDLAYFNRPSTLISKDHALLIMAKITAKTGVCISKDYNAFLINDGD